MNEIDRVDSHPMEFLRFLSLTSESDLRLPRLIVCCLSLCARARKKLSFFRSLFVPVDVDVDVDAVVGDDGTVDRRCERSSLAEAAFDELTSGICMAWMFARSLLLRGSRVRTTETPEIEFEVEVEVAMAVAVAVVVETEAQTETELAAAPSRPARLTGLAECSLVGLSLRLARFRFSSLLQLLPLLLLLLLLQQL